jgi:hypothetical protein
MDDITRQILALLRKTRSDIHKAIQELESIQSSDSHYEQYSPDPSSEEPEEQGELLSAIRAIRIAQGSADAKKYALDHRRYRLEWKGHLIGRWGFFVLVIYAFFTAVIAVYSIRSSDAAKTANQLSQQTIEAQIRPWIGVDGEPSNIKQVDPIPGSSPPQFGVEFTLNLRNYGQFPAMRVGYEFIADHKYTAPLIKMVCDAADEKVVAERYMPSLTTIFPASPKPIEISKGKWGPIHPFVSNPVIVCIAYRGRSSDHSPYHTVVVYRQDIQAGNVVKLELLDSEAN